MHILAGCHGPTDGTRVTKKIRDDILWENAENPNRRSSMWFCIKVALHTKFVSILGQQNGRLAYKLTILMILTRLCEIKLKTMKANEDDGTDIPFQMIKKIAKRKEELSLDVTLNNDLQVFGKRVFSRVNDVCLDIRRTLDARWEEFRKKETVHFDLTKVNFQKDTRIRIPRVNEYVEQLLHKQEASIEYTLCTTSQADPICEFKETWNQLSMIELFKKTEVYIDSARVKYASNPEGWSEMFLTVCEVWMKFDKHASEEHPILKEHYTGIDLSIFTSLLLPFRSQVRRLCELEKYIVERNNSAKHYPIYDPGSAVNNPKSFANRFYEQSQDMKRVKNNILLDAIEKRAAKRIEVKKEMQHVREETARMDRLDHYHAYWNSCDKCCTRRALQRRMMAVHEWPLPDDDVAAQIVVFELRVPQILSQLRDLTYRIVGDLCDGDDNVRETKSGAEVYMNLSEYHALSQWHTSSSKLVTIGSSTKPFASSHYASQSFVHSGDDAWLKPNGLTYYPTTTHKRVIISKSVTILQHCKLKIFDEPYKCLQWTIDSDRYTENEVYAKQSTCHQDLSLPEFISFGTLRAQSNLQWRNIIAVLEDRSLSIKTQAAYALLCQVAWQANEGENSELHHNAMLVRHLLKLLDDTIERFTQNWNERNVVATITTLACHILTITNNERNTSIAKTFIHKCRQLVKHWIVEMKAVCARLTDPKDIIEMRQCIALTAACGALTYAVDADYLNHVVTNDNDQLDWLVFISQINDELFLSDATVGTLPIHDQNILWRVSRSARRIFNKYGASITDNVLNMFVLQAWPTAKEITTEVWRRDGAVVHTIYTLSPKVGSMQLDFLSGKFLVDGMPIARLGQDVIDHPLYKRNFDPTLVFDVLPYGYKTFVTKQSYHEATLTFMMGTELQVIEKLHGVERVLLPHSLFKRSLPSDLVNKYQHWYNKSTHEIEFRALGQSIFDVPTVQYRFNIEQNILVEASGRTLININSDSFTVVTKKVLDRLERPKYMQMFIEQDRIVVDLPRMGLQFFVNQKNNTISSREHSNMIVCPKQTIGTLIGLQKGLLLRNEFQQRLLVPNGSLAFIAAQTHHYVDIESKRLFQPPVLEYEVNEDLQELQPAMNLNSKLTLAYLHAATSHYLADPFTGVTGYEMAIRILQSLCNSTQPLSEASVSILKRIDALAPQRKYYPPKLKKMQTVVFPSTIHSVTACDVYPLLTDMIIQSSMSLSCLFSEKTEFKREPVRQELAAKAYWRDLWQYSTNGHLHEQFEKKFPKPSDQVYVTRYEHDKHICSVAEILRNRGYPDPNEQSTFYEFLSSEDGVLEPIVLGANIFEQIDAHPRKSWLSILNYAAKLSTEEQVFFYSLLVYQNPQYANRIMQMCYITREKLYSLNNVEYHLSEGYTYDKDIILSLLLNSNLLQHGTDLQKQLLVERMTKKNDAVSAAWEKNEFTSASEFKELAGNSMEAIRMHMKRWSQNYSFKTLMTSFMRLYNLSLSSSMQKHTISFVNKDSLYSPSLPCQSWKFTPVHNVIGDKKEFKIKLPAFTLFRMEDNKDENIPFPMACINYDSFECKINNNFQQDLQDSWKQLGQVSNSWERVQVVNDIKEQIVENRKAVVNQLKRVRLHLERKWVGNSDSAYSADIVPKFSQRLVLEHLLSAKHSTLPASIKSLILQLGELITQKQRLERCLQYIALDDSTNLKKELFNVGHTNWKIEDHPEWLLLEIENKFIVRPIQAQVAKKMLSTDSDGNFVLQLNMGEGKTAVIVPLLAASLTDTNRLVRVVVPRPLLHMMYDILQNKMGGILDRTVHLLPFQRSLQPMIGLKELDGIARVYQHCKEQRGVMITAPEYLLSFQLMSLERTLPSETAEGAQIAAKYIEIQKWLDDNARDILDESDEILSVKNQLVYTIGVQESLDGGELRWTIVQKVLQSLKKLASQFAKSYPNDFEYKEDARYEGSFPHFRCISSDDSAYKHLCLAIMQDLIKNRIFTFNMSNDEKKLLTIFALQEDIDESLIKAAEKIIDNDTHAFKTLLMLRGLLGCKVLYFSLGKRWRVNYGVAPSGPRKMAVPFRAKDLASERTEFGHADVAIILTQLSYYYSGLTESQIEQAFSILFEIPNRNEKYHEWISCVNAPTSISTIDGINLKDTEQKILIHQLMSRNTAVINFWLSNAVFYNESKQFQHKLSSSGWDIAKKKTFPTTGFSGTNDTRLLLPISIKQDDLPELKGTNALVVKHLLREENQQYRVLPNNVSGLELLKTIRENILLDVGALMLELDNAQVGKEWLAMADQRIRAAIYFENDNIVVRDRNNRIESLTTSPYRQQLDKCVIYLDDAHCRGTDLKFPPDARAALTLGKGVSKDKFVQGCMRMRLLGYGQSLTFYASHEVDLQIRKIFTPHVSDILKWTLDNSRKTTEEGFLLFCTQGLSFFHRDEQWKNMGISSLGEACKEADAMTLSDLYGGIRQKQTVAKIIEHKCRNVPNADLLISHCKSYVGDKVRYAQLMEEEQERELETEKEDERQVFRPVHNTPMPPSLHKDVELITENKINEHIEQSEAFVPFSASMFNTTLAEEFKQIRFESNLYCTKDFINVVHGHGDTDEYIRIVRYIAVDEKNNVILLSQFEASQLLSKFKLGKGAQLRMFVPRTRPGQSTLFYHKEVSLPVAKEVIKIGKTAKAELSVFAASLYFNSNKESDDVCEFLGLALDDRPIYQKAFADKKISKSGFVPVDVRKQVEFGEHCKFENDPCMLIQKYIHKRSRNESMIVSHLGLIVTRGEKKNVDDR